MVFPRPPRDHLYGETSAKQLQLNELKTKPPPDGGVERTVQPTSNGKSSRAIGQASRTPGAAATTGERLGAARMGCTTFRPILLQDSESIDPKIVVATSHSQDGVGAMSSW